MEASTTPTRSEVAALVVMVALMIAAATFAAVVYAHAVVWLWDAL